MEVSFYFVGIASCVVLLHQSFHLIPSHPSFPLSPPHPCRDWGHGEIENALPQDFELQVGARSPGVLVLSLKAFFNLLPYASGLVTHCAWGLSRNKGQVSPRAVSVGTREKILPRTNIVQISQEVRAGDELLGVDKCSEIGFGRP